MPCQGKVLDRGEKIELLVDKTENLQFQADHCFQRQRRQLRRIPWFVTWKKVVNGGEPRLRGCVGTLEARSIITGFQDYALTSALRDRRFPPIQAKELPALECTVSILTDYETASHYLDWEVGKHGLIIEFTDPNNNARRSATYLPEVAAHEGNLIELFFCYPQSEKENGKGMCTPDIYKACKLYVPNTCL
ncbi:AMMECR1 domain-containing protein [Salix suchowensis]|nr:AMMECR1 domain-containing protein [Salix suchowensis]